MMFDYPDRYLLNDILHLLGQTAIKENSWKRDYRIFPVFSSFGIVCRFYLNESLNMMTALIRKTFETQGLFVMRVYYLSNFEEIVTSISGNEYLKTSWEHVNRTMLEILIGYMNGSIGIRGGKFPKILKNFFNIRSEYEKVSTSQNLLEEKQSKDTIDDTIDIEMRRSQQNPDDDDYLQLLKQTGKKLKILNEALEKIPPIRVFKYVIYLLIFVKISLYFRN